MSVITGDCAQVLPTLAVSPHLIVTSPPYASQRDYGGHGFDLEAVADAIVSVMRPGAVLAWVVGDPAKNGRRQGLPWQHGQAFMGRGLWLHDTIIWEKGSGIPKPPSVRHTSAHEYILILSQGRPATVSVICDRPAKSPSKNPRIKTIRQRDGTFDTRRWSTPEVLPRTNVWRQVTGWRHAAPDFPRAHDHPGIFPYRLAADLIRTFSAEGDLVLDPMAGSGTVLAAARDLGRDHLGIEIHEPYADLARERLR